MQDTELVNPLLSFWLQQALRADLPHSYRLHQSLWFFLNQQLIHLYFVFIVNICNL